jgi:hypothetical protein
MSRFLTSRRLPDIEEKLDLILVFGLIGNHILFSLAKLPFIAKNVTISKILPSTQPRVIIKSLSFSSGSSNALVIQSFMIAYLFWLVIISANIFP